MMVAVFQLTVRFLLELVLFIGLAYWGFQVEGSVLLQFIAGLGLPVAAAIVWGKLLSPKRTIKLGLPWRLLIEFALMGAAFVCYYDLGYHAFAILFGIVQVVNRTCIVIWDIQDWPVRVKK
ncbi:YrdB family protein [Paenibacillus gorillae]|uniref:YrdB family protein n=1 Tax=Paenibacillus gorillae TaxID=1243662 RepID=UPI0004B84EEC|nr:YrdB family protein [Paenibacillus gorillae]